MTDSTERWLPVVGYEDLYRISDRGRIWSNWHGGRIMKASPTGADYLTVALCRGDGTKKTHMIHVLVMEAFAGPRPTGMQVLHGPGGHLDNRWPENLSWGTAFQNNGPDKYRDGTQARGEKQHLAKLTEDAIRDIMARGTNGPRGIRAQLAREYGVHKGTIGRVLDGKTWRHVG